MNELNHPYLKTLQGTLSGFYKLQERLVKDTILIKENYATKSEFEKNRIEISIIKTNNEIESINKVIDARENYFKKYIQQFVIDLKECDDNFDSVLETAKQKSAKNNNILNTLNSIVWDVVNSNIEAKIKLYQHIKKIIS